MQNSTPNELVADDWDGIRAACHEVRPFENSYQARNPGQRWTTTFDDRGFLVEPDSGSWRWGLELESYGFAGRERTVTGPAKATAEGGRVAYAWGDTLEEWYVNDRRGLEHGFTVRDRPPQDPADGVEPLTFTLAIRGELRPEVTVGGRGVRFVTEDGAAVLDYSGLIVFDAAGRELAASFERDADRLRLAIDERDALYPLTIDPIAQQAYLKASNTDPWDYFGKSVAVSGNTVAVAALLEAGSTTGVNGDEADNGAVEAGAVYVFVRNGPSWSQEAYLKASNTDRLDHFGISVAISGDTIVVGANLEDSSSTGVNGNEGDNSAEESGAAYVFVRNGTSWTQEAYLKASNTDPGDWFGWVVSVSGDTLLVGAPRESSGAVGVNGGQTDNGTYWGGAAYVFRRNGTSWSQEAYLKASNTDVLDFFGGSVALDGDTAVIGACDESSSATGVNGDHTDNSAVSAGAAYVFVRHGATWSQEAYLKASNTEQSDEFGHAVSLSGDLIAVAALAEASGATGVNGDQSRNDAEWAGAVYLFERTGASWSQEAYLKASNTDTHDMFGFTLSVSGDLVAVGAPNECNGATGLNGDQSDNSAPSAGAAYVFARQGTSWGQLAYLKASNTDSQDGYGLSVSAAGNTIVVGAYAECSAATGVHGDQADNSATKAGAAYVLSLEGPGVGFCFGDPGSGTPCPCANDNDGTVPGSGCDNGVFSSGAHLSAAGVPSVTDDSLMLVATGLEPNSPGIYFQANRRLSGGDGIFLGDGLRCAGGGLIRLQVVASDASGTSSTTISLSTKGGVVAGDTKRYQCWYGTTTNPPCGSGLNDFNLSNGYEVLWLP